MVTPVASGPEFRVNTYTPNFQNASAVAALPDGGFVTVWMSERQEPADTGSQQFGIYGQRHDAAGNPLGAEFHVNTSTAGSQGHPAVTALADGSFVVAWDSQTASGTTVLAQRFGPTGTPSGSEFQINTQPGGSFSSVEGLSDGGFVVTWWAGDNDVHAQRFSTGGAPVGPELTVNTTLAGRQSEPDVAALTDGGFAVTWVSYSQTSSGREIYSRVYDASGSPVGGEVRVNTTAFGEQPSVTALAEDGFVVAWTGGGVVRAQKFLDSGSPAGPELVLSTSGSQPTTSALPDGGFLVTWTRTISQASSDYDVFGRQYDANGAPVGTEFRVNTHQQGAQLESEVATLANGDAVVSWTSYGQDPSGSIYGQRLDVTRSAPSGDDDPVIASRFNIVGPAAQSEGNGGTTPFVFTVTRNADATGTALVDYFVPTFNTPGPNASDFSGQTGGTLTFAPGEFSKTIQINVVGDSVREPDEPMSVQLSNPRGGAINVDRAHTTILNDDGDTPPVATLTWGTAAAGVSQLEGDSGATPFTYVVNRSGDTGGTTTVDWRVTFSSALPDDFAGPLTGTLTFGPNELSKEIRVLVAGDTRSEADEAFQVSLSNAPGASLPFDSRPGRILNDDGAEASSSFSISGPAAAAEGTGGTTPIEFTVTRSGSTSTLGIIDYFTVGATDAADFSGRTTGSLYFAAGETTKTIRLDVIGDTTREADEDFFVGLSNARGGAIATGRANSAILNDDSDTPPAATITWGTDPGGITRNEGDSGVTPFTYTLNRSGDTSGTTSIDWRVNPASASPDDFSGPTTGTVTFAPGETSRTLTVNVVGDTVPEADELFSIVLSNSPGATFPQSGISGRISNDDTGAGAATVSISGPGAKPEGTGANTFFDFTVMRSGDTSGRTLVDYYLIGETNPADFTGRTTGTLYFEIGETSKLVRIEVVGDAVAEPDESFILGLSNPRFGVLGASQAPARILDDDGWVMS